MIVTLPNEDRGARKLHATQHLKRLNFLLALLYVQLFAIFGVRVPYSA